MVLELEEYRFLQLRWAVLAPYAKTKMDQPELPPALKDAIHGE